MYFKDTKSVNSGGKFMQLAGEGDRGMTGGIQCRGGRPLPFQLYRVYKRKGNPNLACHCALYTGCMNVIFFAVIKIKSQLFNLMFLCHFEQKNPKYITTIKISGQSHIFSPLCLIKAVHITK